MASDRCQWLSFSRPPFPLHPTRLSPSHTWPLTQAPVLSDAAPLRSEKFKFLTVVCKTIRDLASVYLFSSPTTTLQCILHIASKFRLFFFNFNFFNSPKFIITLFHLRSFMVLVPTKNTHLYPKFQSRQHFLQDAFIPATISAFSTLLGAATPAQASHNITMTIIFVFLTLASSQREHAMCTCVLMGGPPHRRWSSKIYQQWMNDTWRNRASQQGMTDHRQHWPHLGLSLTGQG